MRGWLRRLLGDDDGPPKVTLPAPRREPKPDHALARLLPADPRPSRTRAEAAQWRCPALHGPSEEARPCGLPKTPEKTTCGRPKCKAWATRKATEERPRGRAKVLSMGGRG